MCVLHALLVHFFYLTSCTSKFKIIYMRYLERLEIGMFEPIVLLVQVPNDMIMLAVLTISAFHLLP